VDSTQALTHRRLARRQAPGGDHSTAVSIQNGVWLAGLAPSGAPTSLYWAVARRLCLDHPDPTMSEQVPHPGVLRMRTSQLQYGLRADGRVAMYLPDG